MSEWRVLNEGHRIGITREGREWWLAVGSLSICRDTAAYLNTLEAEVERLKGALEEYGVHKEGCLAESHYAGKWDSSDPEAMAALREWLAGKVCNCGYAALKEFQKL